MDRQLKRTGPVAWAVMLALAVVSSATCLTAAAMTPAQKACCAAMNHDCGEAAIEQDCCPSEQTTVQTLSPAASAGSVSPPFAVLVAVLEPQAPPGTSAGLLPDSRGGAVKPPGAPTYLLVSTFRI